MKGVTDRKIARLIDELTGDVARCRERWHPSLDACHKCAEWSRSIEYLQSLRMQQKGAAR